MLNAVWVAVIAAACCFMMLAVVSVYVLMKMAGLISQTSAAVTGLRDRSGEVIDRAHAAIDATSGQLARTDAITASMDEVTTSMADLTGRVTALAPLGRLAAASAGGGLGRLSALAYGLRHAAQLRGAGPGGRPPGTPRAPLRAGRGAAAGDRLGALTAADRRTAPGPAGPASTLRSPARSEAALRSKGAPR